MEALATGWKGEEVPHPAHFSAMLLPSKTLFQIPSLSTYSSFSLPQVNGSLQPNQRKPWRSQWPIAYFGIVHSVVLVGSKNILPLSSVLHLSCDHFH